MPAVGGGGGGGGGGEGEAEGEAASGAQRKDPRGGGLLSAGPGGGGFVRSLSRRFGSFKGMATPTRNKRDPGNVSV